MEYYDKYIKYKKKYVNLKNKKSYPYSHKFYITHRTRCDNLPLILSDGFIRAGKDIDPKYILENWDISKIFGNIMFDEYRPKDY